MKRFIPSLFLLCFSFTLMQAQTLISGGKQLMVQSTALPKAEPLYKATSANGENDKAPVTCTDKNRYPDQRLQGSSTYNFFLRSGGSLTVLQFYPDFTGKVTGLFFNGRSPNVANNSVNLVVYTNSFGSPGTRMANTSTNVGTTSQEWGSNFASPFNVSGGFFAGVEYNVLTQDTVLIETNSDGNGQGDAYAWFQDNLGNLNSVLFDIGIDVDFLIRPTIEFTASGISFNPSQNSSCPGENISFNNTSSLPAIFSSPYFNSKSANPYQWNYGDGSPVSNTTNGSHSYTGPAGTYTVQLAGVFEGGTTNCQVIDSNHVEVKEEPEAFFAYTSDKLNVTFVNKSKFGSSYDWDLGNAGATSSILNPIYSYPAPGTYPVTLEVTGDCGTDAHATFIQVSDTMNFSTVSIREIDRKFGVSVYPNPARDKLILKFEGLQQSRPADITVINILGKVVFSDKVAIGPQASYQLQLENYVSGTYVIQVKTDTESIAKLFQKY